ncbi:MAG: hypothetical protein JXX29_23295 [Deltaproteobacteria bacterium]|nr:hypothetical protein [Deltaproteobacteria bacterium]MBN2674627.1 hypothetical protein [Deltaproteobacteria bacterium]
MKKNILKTLGFTIAAICLVGVLHEVVAANAENVFAGKIIVLRKIPPSYFNTKNGFVNFLKSSKNRYDCANPLPLPDEGAVDFQAMVFFKKPLGDYEVEMLFHDVGSRNGGKTGAEVFKGSVTQYTQDRNTRSMLARTSMTRQEFDADRKFKVEIQSHGKTVASGFFCTKGMSQAEVDQQKRVHAQQEEMRKSMEELKKKAAEQEAKENQEQRKKDAEAGQDLF